MTTRGVGGFSQAAPPTTHTLITGEPVNPNQRAMLMVTAQCPDTLA